MRVSLNARKMSSNSDTSVMLEYAVDCSGQVSPETTRVGALAWYAEQKIRREREREREREMNQL